MLRIAAILATLVAFRGSARAECVAISGADELVRPVAAILIERGIILEAACMHVVVERRGAVLAITVDHADGPIERTVAELETVATVIESFVRDTTAPLLPIRERPASRVVVVHELAAPQRPVRDRRVQVFTSVETSMGSDDTNWLGGMVGVCIPLGPICAAARIRHASVVAGEGKLSTEMMTRRSSEILLGLDVPFDLGRMTLSPGFAAGIGNMWTKAADDTRVGESGGLRADVHATLTVGLSTRWALDFSAALDLTQETHAQSELEMALPAEPLALLRFGVGLRWGRR
jgi:hypothetical protein